MDKIQNAAQMEMNRKYKELMDSIDEMDGEDQQQVEEWKAVLVALVNEALDVKQEKID